MAESSDIMNIIVRLKDQASRNLKDLDKGLLKLPKAVKLVNRSFASFTKSLKVIGREVRGVENAVFSLQGVIASVGVGVLAHSFTQAASAAEQYRTRLTVLLGSQAEGNRLFKEMADYASSVSFEYEQVMGAATALSGVMKGGVDEIVKWMPMIGDLAAAAGMGIEETTSQIIRMYSAGAASADMFRERGILAMLGFQAGVSYTASQTREQLIRAWEDPLSKFRGASSKLASTWNGLLSMMSDAWFQFRNLVMESGVFDMMKATVSVLLDKIKEIKEKGQLQDWAKSLSDSVVSAMRSIIIWSGAVAESFQGWLMVWDALKISYASLAPYLLTTLRLIVNIVGGISIAFWGVADALGKKGLAKALKNTIDMLGDIDKNAETSKEFWADVKKDAEEHLATITNQVSYYDKISKVLDAIDQKVKSWKENQKEILSGGKKTRTSGDLPGKLTPLEKQLKRAEQQFQDALVTGGGTGQIVAEQLRRGIADGLKKVKTEVKSSFEYIQELSLRTAEAIEQNFSDFFFDVMTGKFKDLGDYARGILRSIQRAVSDLAGQMIKDAIFGKTTGAGAGGGTTGGLVNWFKKVLGLQSGGLVPGSSPTSKADNIPIRATAGEFMQPVDVVKYYGANVMESMRRKLIPKELFTGLGVPYSSHSGRGYATGGMISGGRQKTTVNIINKSGVGLESSEAQTEFRADEMILNVVLDAATRNKGGFKTGLRGALNG